MTLILRTSLLVVALAVCAGAPTAAVAQEKLSFYGRVPDADGIDRRVKFQGVIHDGLFDGRAIVEGNPLVIVGTFAPDGSLRALVMVERNGGILGSVNVRLDPRSADRRPLEVQIPDMSRPVPEVEVDYDLGGRKGSLNASEKNLVTRSHPQERAPQKWRDPRDSEVQR